MIIEAFKEYVNKLTAFISSAPGSSFESNVRNIETMIFTMNKKTIILNDCFSEMIVSSFLFRLSSTSSRMLFATHNNLSHVHYSFLPVGSCVKFVLIDRIIFL